MGIGKNLLNSSETIARRAGMQRILLTVFGHNPEVGVASAARSLRFWRREEEERASSTDHEKIAQLLCLLRAPATRLLPFPIRGVRFFHEPSVP